MIYSHITQFNLTFHPGLTAINFEYDFRPHTQRMTNYIRNTMCMNKLQTQNMKTYNLKNRDSTVDVEFVFNVSKFVEVKHI